MEDDRAAFRRLQSSAGRDIDLTKILRKVDVFASLNFAQLQQVRLQRGHALMPVSSAVQQPFGGFISLQLRDKMQPLTFEDGEVVFKQGDDPKKSRDAFYVISKGQARGLAIPLKPLRIAV